MKNTLLVVSLVILPAISASAAEGHGAHADHVMPSKATAANGLSEGTVKKIDAVKATVTLAHGPLPNLAMDPMTMVFAVKEASWLDQWRPGEKIRFHADMVKGRLTVIRWEPFP